MTAESLDATIAASARLVWAAARPSPVPGALADAIDAGAQPAVVAAAALVQRTAPLTWRALAAAGRLDWLGEAERAALRRDFEKRRGQGELLLPHALRVGVQPLVDAGLDPVIFKGPALACRYPAPGLRPMDDIDVLIEPRRHDEAVRVLVAAGWSVHERERTHHDTILFHPAVPDLPLELHRGLDTWRDRASRLTAETLWRVREPLDCLGTQCFGLPAEEEVAALAAHAGKPFHTFRRLIWSVDLAVVIEDAGSRFDWDRFAAFCREVGTETVVAVGLGHARRLGAQVPDELLRLPDSRLRRIALAPLLEEAWPITPVDRGVAHRLRYALRDVRSRRALLLAAEITEGGALRVPERVGALITLGGRRVWSWRRVAAPQREGFT